MNRGLFITFEGCEGAGKTTQIYALSQRLLQNQVPHIVTREPGGTLVAETIRSLIHYPEKAAQALHAHELMKAPDLYRGEEMDGLTELLLFAAARAHHVQHVIRPALEAGKVVLCDRFADSTRAYQTAARGVHHMTVEYVNHVACVEIEPDITFFLDVPPHIGLQRKKSDDEMTRIDHEALGFHERVYAAYQELAEQYPERIYRIGAWHNMVIAITARIWQITEEALQGAGVALVPIPLD